MTHDLILIININKKQMNYKTYGKRKLIFFYIQSSHKF